jgi:predicted kinase
LSGAGKSTYAQELVAQGWCELNRDQWRFHFFCEGKQDWSLYKFTKERENKVTEQLEELWKLNSGQHSAGFYQRNVVVSNTNLNQKDHDYWKAKAEEVGYEFEVKYFDITLEEALKRDSKRGALAVGREVLFGQWKKWLEITNYKRYVPDESKPKAIWIDLDGTLAINTHRGHHDYDKVITDTPRLDVISMLSAWMESDGLTPVFMSGRPDSCREDTVKWLLNYFDDVPYLYMRTTGDNRSDRIVKEELFWEYLEPNWNIVAAVDDRPRITRLEIDLGIPLVINVNRDYLEF